MLGDVLGVPLERSSQPFRRVLVVATMADLRPSEDGVSYRLLSCDVQRPTASPGTAWRRIAGGRQGLARLLSFGHVGHLRVNVF